MRVLTSRQLTILTTDQCTAQCGHCSMNSSPQRRRRLTAEQICRYVDQAVESTEIRLVIFSGGEPLLLGDELFQSLEHVRSRGLRSRLVTNAYWAMDAKKTAATVERLFSAGLNELNISIDDFHFPYIHPQKVKAAFAEARKYPFDAVILVHCSGPDTVFNARELDELVGEKLPRMFNERGDAVPLDRSGKKPFLAVSNSTLQGIGRGTGLQLAQLPGQEDWPQKARAIGGCPWAVRSPAVAPTGHLVACCGFEVSGNPILDIGDLETHSLSDLLDRADQDLPLNMIALEGPYELMDRMKEVQPDLPFRPYYRSFCELCQDMVTNPVLRETLVQIMPLRAPAILSRREGLSKTAAHGSSRNG